METGHVIWSILGNQCRGRSPMSIQPKLVSQNCRNQCSQIEKLVLAWKSAGGTQGKINKGLQQMLEFIYILMDTALIRTCRQYQAQYRQT
jgi:hypothetical protein